MDEVWRECTLHSGYQVSNIGNVRSVTRDIVYKNKNGIDVVFKRQGQMITPYDNGTGYIRVRLERKHHYVHRLVALAFIANQQWKPQVNHKNGIRTDNTVENLEWVTHSENIKHSFDKLGRKPRPKGKDNPLSKPIIGICMKTETEVYYDSATEAVKDGFNGSSISSVCNGRTKSHKGFHWRFG
jgi:hypothetical protein